MLNRKLWAVNGFTAHLAPIKHYAPSEQTTEQTEAATRMALTEIEFELPSQQFERMNYLGLTQGHPLAVILDAGVLLPDPAATAWFTVQKEPLSPALVQIGRAAYAFTGQIVEADIINDEGMESATVWIDCGVTHLRATCAPHEDGRLPEGTWETRTLTGVARLQGIVEDEFLVPIGSPVGMSVWGIRRLMLTPGDPNFGQWHESDDLLPVPYYYDRIVVTARIHRPTL